ncbi:MAG: pyruvate, phosphate dikinase [Nanoarchaeota archaeon]
MKYVYTFDDSEANANMKELLGGKGANLAEMAGKLKLPVPPGFTITTEVCTQYYKNNKKYPENLNKEVEDALQKIENQMERKFGYPTKPLLLSVRSGARKSMPGMMETILNVGLTTKTIPALIAETNNARFVYDCYRRLIMMYADVVMEKAAGIENEPGIRKQLEHLMDDMKRKRQVKLDTELNADDLKQLSEGFKNKIKEVIGQEFPDEHEKQLWGAISAVFQSWNGKRAISYRRIENIPDEWGTAVNIQAMVFGNFNQNSATGVAFTRNPATGEPHFYGEYLINAQGEDVVAGIRTPAPINTSSQSEHNKQEITLETAMPIPYKQLDEIRLNLEKHFKDMLDIEFTIQDGTLYMLQCRVGKRNGPSAVRMAHDMLQEKLITEKEAVMRVTPAQLDELLHPILDPAREIKETPIAKGLPAGPGGGFGQIVFTSHDAVEWAKQGKTVILVREETNPEDIEGMRAAHALLTARGGMTSHAALVARGWGKCCIVGCQDLEIDLKHRTLTIKGERYKEGDMLSLNGSRGLVYKGKLPLMSGAEENKLLSSFLLVCDKIRTLGIRSNSDSPEDAKKALSVGAEGIGLFRTEHMFYGKGSDEPLFLLRKMIVSHDEKERREALDELYPHVKETIKGTLDTMHKKPVTIRLLDPPLHEFVPHQESQRKALSESLSISLAELEKRAEELRETNPMMGHRGVRLGITFPEISEMQFRAIFEAAAELIKEGKDPQPEIMIPVVCDLKELIAQKKLCENIHKDVLIKNKLTDIPYLFGTMIEIPRAALLADQLASVSDFFSFGTNDLTQMTFGFSRDDIGGFVPEYIKTGILPTDPFQSIDTLGVGQLITYGLERGRKTKPKLKVGICGEHGGDPESITFCHTAGMDYVSCSAFRVPIARLAAAQAAVSYPKL